MTRPDAKPPGRVVLVAAADEAWGIGAAGGLPLRCPEDLRHFRKRTAGGILVMGRRTFEELPAPLADRTVLVVSSRAPPPLSDVRAAVASGLAVSDEVIVADGAQVYAQALDLCTSAEVTRISGVHACDAFMPDLAAAGWRIADVRVLSQQAVIEYWEKTQ